jgi:hypothetical protein
MVQFTRDLESRRPRSFFEFLDEDERAVSDVLSAKNMRFSYSIYTRGSRVLHGSSVEDVLVTGPELFAPQVWAADDELKRQVEPVLSWARHSTFGLFLIRPSSVE